MILTYTNQNGESLTLRQRKPFFLQRTNGTGNIRKAVNTFRAPNQDDFVPSAVELEESKKSSEYRRIGTD